MLPPCILLLSFLRKDHSWLRQTHEDFNGGPHFMKPWICLPLSLHTNFVTSPLVRLTTSCIATPETFSVVPVAPCCIAVLGITYLWWNKHIISVVRMISLGLKWFIKKFIYLQYLPYLHPECRLGYKPSGWAYNILHCHTRGFFDHSSSNPRHCGPWHWLPLKHQLSCETWVIMKQFRWVEPSTLSTSPNPSMTQQNIIWETRTKTNFMIAQ